MWRWILEGMVLSWLQQIPTATPVGARHFDNHIFIRPYIKPINFKPSNVYTSIPSTFLAPIPSPSLTQAWFVFLSPYFPPDPSCLSPENTAKLLMSLSLKSLFAEVGESVGGELMPISSLHLNVPWIPNRSQAEACQDRDFKTLDSLKLHWSLGLEAQGDANDVQDCRTFSYRDSDTERGWAF